MNNKRKLLIVEDDPGLQSQMRWCFDDIDVQVANDKESALAMLRRHEPQVVTLDLGLPPDPGGSSAGFNTLQEILLLCPETKVIVITGREEKSNAVSAIGMGAIDFYQKPMDADILKFIVDRAFKLYELETKNKELIQNYPSTPLNGIIASSDIMRNICRTVEKIAPTDISVLILGETGTGKEVIAKAIHQLSHRKKKSFIAINCGAIPENLLESELFGHEKGSFTGASHQKTGKIEIADGGTLFLDEIGDMPAPLQVKLLRFLQERVIERVGGIKPIPVDVRVILATHQNLQNLITKNLFREDLFYRVSEISLQLPPLRDRGGDKVLLAKSILNSQSRQLDRTGLTLSEDAISAINNYDWPGNVREMINKVKRAVIMSDSKRISAEDIELASYSTISNPMLELNLRITREKAEVNAIKQVLSTAETNMTQAAKMLGITRPTLYSLIEKYKISASVPEKHQACQDSSQDQISS